MNWVYIHIENSLCCNDREVHSNFTSIIRNILLRHQSRRLNKIPMCAHRYKALYLLQLHVYTPRFTAYFRLFHYHETLPIVNLSLKNYI